MGPEESPKTEPAKEPNAAAENSAAGDERLASTRAPDDGESSERRNGRLTGSSFPAEPRSEGPLHWRAAGMLLTLRPHQWIKNVFVLAPVVFAKTIFQVELLTRAAGAFGVFCLLAGAVYTINDLADVEADRQHPIKRHRPIASGRVPVGAARVMAVVLILTALATAAVGFGPAFFAVAAGYFCINLAYSFRLKHVAYLDVSCIAAGFVLRVMAGGYGTEVYVSRYLLLCTALLAAFLGFGKRRHELAGAVNAKRQRAALESYNRTGLDRALWITALLTVGTYVAYTLDPHTRAYFQSDWLWPSTVFVVLGVLRFVTLVRSRPRAESPTQEMIKDGPFVGIVLLWVILVFWVVYHLRPG
jgi:4-hydroxybenzoate polyprenyltransferase